MAPFVAPVFGTVDGRNDISPKEGKSVYCYSRHPRASSLVEPLFDGFLCASIGDDRNGTGLIVPCPLARLSVDPWQQATSLARMPQGSGCNAMEHADVVTAGQYRLQQASLVSRARQGRRRLGCAAELSCKKGALIVWAGITAPTDSWQDRTG